MSAKTGLKSHPLADAFPRMDAEAFDDLASSIRDNGLRRPIVLLEGKVLDGRHRLRACEAAGVEAEFEEFEGGDPVAFIVDENVRRRHLTVSQRAMVAASLAEGSRKGKRKANLHCPNSDNINPKKPTIGQAANLMGVSRSTAHEALKVKREAPEVAAAVAQGTVRLNDAARIASAPKEDQKEALKRVEGKKAKTLTSAVAQISKERVAAQPQPPAPSGRFKCVVVDPPWPIQFGMDRPSRPTQAVGTPYPPMTIDEIKALDLPLDDDAWVFLWTIQQFLRESFGVLDAWGLDHKFTMAWVKPHGPQSAGMPQSNMEFVLVGRKGKPQFLDTKRFPMAFSAPKRKGHSAKPDEFYRLLGRVSAGPRLDMFSRREIPGFESWGKEAKP